MTAQRAEPLSANPAQGVSIIEYTSVKKPMETAPGRSGVCFYADFFPFMELTIA